MQLALTQRGLFPSSHPLYFSLKSPFPAGTPRTFNGTLRPTTRPVVDWTWIETLRQRNSDSFRLSDFV
jgi:hypothetical protein